MKQEAIENRLEAIEKMIGEIYAALVTGQDLSRPGLEEYRRALTAMADGDMKPMRLYLRRGGVILPSEAAFPEASESCMRR